VINEGFALYCGGIVNGGIIYCFSQNSFDDFTYPNAVGSSPPF
jgi:hypothetical protein